MRIPHVDPVNPRAKALIPEGPVQHLPGPLYNKALQRKDTQGPG